LKPVFPVFSASLRRENLLAIGRQILHDALVAIVTQRHRIDLNRAVALIEQCLFTGSIPGSSNATADEHEIPLFERVHWGIPANDGQLELVTRAQQDIPGMKVCMAQDEPIRGARSLP